MHISLGNKFPKKAIGMEGGFGVLRAISSDSILDRRKKISNMLINIRGWDAYIKKNIYPILNIPLFVSRKW